MDGSRTDKRRPTTEGREPGFGVTIMSHYLIVRLNRCLDHWFDHYRQPDAQVFDGLRTISVGSDALVDSGGVPFRWRSTPPPVIYTSPVNFCPAKLFNRAPLWDSWAFEKIHQIYRFLSGRRTTDLRLRPVVQNGPRDH